MDVLSVEKVAKSFPGVRAVRDVSLGVARGEVLALVGENGAGKSTLSQIIAGVYRPDAGRLLLEGREVIFGSPLDALRAGVAIVFQELSLVGGLSIAENIFIHNQPVGALDRIRWAELHDRTAELLRRFEVSLHPRTLVKRLSKGQQQIVEIVKALSTDPKLLVLDEPTSSLTETETRYVFEAVRRLRARGTSVLYISHRLSEVFALADRVAVMRDGAFVGAVRTAETSERQVISMMVGREIGDIYGARRRPVREEPVLQVRGLSRRGAFSGVSFIIRRGEILGFSGLVGSGRTELARAVAGIDRHDEGEVLLAGRVLPNGRPREAIERGLAYVTEDRKDLGLYLGMTVQDNVVAPSLAEFSSRLGLLQRRHMAEFAVRIVSGFAIRTPSARKRVGLLSGGNQQKCLIASWMSRRPEVIVFDEPTRGVDMGARQDIYRKIREYVEAGGAAIVISSELPELIGLCDRILVMHCGRLRGEVDRGGFGEEVLLSFATGVQPSNQGRS
jgi:ABC-type sugar transport system ATPase subunit